MNGQEELLTGGGRGGGDGRAEGSSAIGDREQAAISLMPGIDGTHICIFESLQLEGSYVGDLLYICIYIYIYFFFYCMFLLLKRIQKEQKHLA